MVKYPPPPQERPPSFKYTFSLQKGWYTVYGIINNFRFMKHTGLTDNYIGEGGVCGVHEIKTIS